MTEDNKFYFVYLGTPIRIKWFMEDGLAVCFERSPIAYYESGIDMAPGQWLHTACNALNISEPYQWLFNKFGLTDETVRIAIKYAQLKIKGRIEGNLDFNLLQIPKPDMTFPDPGFYRPFHGPILDDSLFFPSWPSDFSTVLQLFLDASKKKDAAQAKVQQAHGPITHLPLSLSHDVLKIGEYLEWNKEKIVENVGIQKDKIGDRDILEAFANAAKRLNETFWANGKIHPDGIADNYLTHGWVDECDSLFNPPSHWQMFRRWIKKLLSHALHYRKRSH